MLLSPVVERREILLPSLDIVHGHFVSGFDPTSYDHVVTVDLVRDSAGFAVINNDNNLNTFTLFNTDYVSYLSGKPGSCVPSGFTRVVVLKLSLLL